jgi:hypothetical protein
MQHRKVIIAVAGLAGAIASGIAQSSPVTYDWTSGSITVLAINGNNGTTLGSGVVALTAPSQVTLDTGVAMDVPSFAFDDMGTSSAALGGALTGDTLTVTNLTIVPETTGYTSSATGTNPYNITLNGLAASGSYSIANASNVVISSGSFTNTITPTLTGAITIGPTNSLTLNGIALDVASIGTTPVTFKADVIFDGAPVPLPAAVWLLGSGLVALAGAALRRRPGVSYQRVEA